MIKAKPARLDAHWYSWTGTAASETASLLGYDDNIRKGSIQIADLGTITGTTAAYSNELSLGLRPDVELDSDLQTKDVKVFSIHNPFPDYIDLLAAASATYVEPTAAGASGGVPADTDLMPGTPETSQSISLDYNATNKEFAYLYLQAKKAAGTNTTSFDPALIEGESGLVFVNGVIVIGEGELSGRPAGNAVDYIQHANAVDIFVMYNGNMVRIGCYDSEFEVNPNVEYGDMTKRGSIISTKMTARSLEITGTFSGDTAYNQKLLLQGEIDDTDTQFMKVKISDDVDEVPVAETACWLRARTDYGRAMWLYSPRTVLMPNGGKTLGGSDGTKVPFTVKVLGGWQNWHSRDLLQPFRLAVKVKTAAT